MEKPIIAVIGAGNMGCALIDGLQRTGYPSKNIWVSNPQLDSRADWLARYPELHRTTDNIKAVQASDVVILAVKPLQIHAVVQELQSQLSAKRRLVISIAAGIRMSAIEKIVPQNPIVRAMPNLAAKVGASATGLVKNSFVNPDERDVAESLLRSIGVTTWCQQESDLDVVTAIAGSGPAYFFYLMEIMEAAAIEMGLSDEQARLLVMQTAEGAAKVAMTSQESTAELRAKVTSKGGTTAAAFDFLTQPAFRDTLQRALESARDRAAAIANELE